MMLHVFLKFIPGYKECQRIEAITKTPLVNQMVETNSGSSSIKAFGTKKVFEDRFMGCLRDNILAFMFSAGTLNWFQIRIGIISILLMVISTSVCIWFRFSDDPILVGLTF